MRTVGPASEDEMVLEFLQAELESERWHDRTRAAIGDTTLLTTPDLHDQAQNAARRRALGKARGYNDSDVFRSYPTDITWVRLEATVDEVAQMRHINFEGIRKQSAGSLIVADSAANIDTIEVTEDHQLSNRVRAVAAALTQGHRLRPLIALAPSPDHVLRIMEGNTRAAACVLALTHNDTVPIIAGHSPAVLAWEHSNK